MHLKHKISKKVYTTLHAILLNASRLQQSQKQILNLSPITKLVKSALCNLFISCKLHPLMPQAKTKILFKQKQSTLSTLQNSKIYTQEYFHQIEVLTI